METEKLVATSTNTNKSLPSASYHSINLSSNGKTKTKMNSEQPSSARSAAPSTQFDRRAMFAKSKAHKAKRNLYDWRKYSPDDCNFFHLFRWLMVGGSAFAAKQSDEDLFQDLSHLASCLQLLREYLQTYGMPEKGGKRDTQFVLREIVRDLYSGGAPIWALETIMHRAAEGLTGQKDVNWFLLPRKAFVFQPTTAATSMFKIDRGFVMSKMDCIEPIAVRLASFASNTDSVSNIPSRFPTPEELNMTRTVAQESFRNKEAVSLGGSHGTSESEANELAEEILELASSAQGLFFFVNSHEYEESNKAIDEFWTVSEEERKLFSRLACLEAMESIKQVDAEAKANPLYSPTLFMIFRVIASAAACAFWFGGSWQDMIVSGFLAVVVAWIGQSEILSKQEKIIYEATASFIVGCTAMLIALTWPDQTCFGAMAISGVLDILQGFRVVYAIIEIMSKHTVAGAADLCEGILYTALISYFLRFGQYVAKEILGESSDSLEFTVCTNGINDLWFLLLVPAAAVSWSGLFAPPYRDLLPMAYHGVLGYAISYGLTQLKVSSSLNNFVSASAISLSAGIISRFTGRQAVGNTVAGLYVLVPGAYLVKSLYSDSINGAFFTDIVQKAVIIGIGAWTGSILCSPTLLGTTRGLMSQQSMHSNIASSHERNRAAVTPTTMLYF